MSETATNAARHPGQDTATGRWLPGNRASPRGRASVADRIRAAAIDLALDFQRVHGRPPTRSEQLRIETAAGFRVQSNRERAHSMEDRNKMARTSELILRKLGIDRPARATNGSMQSGRAALASYVKAEVVK
jgi:hypothetical protein